MVQAQLGDKAGADQELQAFLKAHKVSGPNEWPAKIAAFFFGQLSEEDFLVAAQTSPAATQGNLCEAWYYAGKKRLIAGDKESAKTYFTECVGTKKSTFLEYRAARMELQSPGE